MFMVQLHRLEHLDAVVKPISVGTIARLFDLSPPSTSIFTNHVTIEANPSRDNAVYTAKGPYIDTLLNRFGAASSDDLKRVAFRST